MWRRFGHRDEGATMVEYGVMIALIAVALIVTLSVLGQSFKTTFTRTSNGVANAETSNAGPTAGGPVNDP
jgi:pilus assembly protein Flp/PilA